MMKKILIIGFVLWSFFAASNKIAFAENLTYPFESITIIEAQKFDVVIPTGLSENSLLYGKVEVGDTVTVYIAKIVMKELNGENESQSTVLILTSQDDMDIVRFVINNFGAVIDVEFRYGFASHILIDAAIGVYKDMELINQMQELQVFHQLTTNQLTLTDNAGLVMPMVENSYEFETNLNIVISINTGE